MSEEKLTAEERAYLGPADSAIARKAIAKLLRLCSAALARAEAAERNCERYAHGKLAMRCEAAESRLAAAVELLAQARQGAGDADELVQECSQCRIPHAVAGIAVWRKSYRQWCTDHDTFLSPAPAQAAEPAADECDNCHAVIDGNQAATSDICFDCWQSARADLATARARIAELEGTLLLESTAVVERDSRIDQAVAELECAREFHPDGTRTYIDRALAALKGETP